MAKLFKKIDNAISKVGSALSNENRHKDDSAVGDLGLENKEQLIDSVMNALKKFIEEKESTKLKRLVIWLDTDELTFKKYDVESYRKRMMRAIVNESGYLFNAVNFAIGCPDKSLRCTSINDNGKEFIQILDNDPGKPKIARKAEITVFAGNGSMKQEKYILSPEDMKERIITYYNIGSGEFPELPSGVRQNHIVIDDDPNSPMVEKNKYVSRMHAHIGFSEQFGFYLQVEIDGTRMMGKRTRIIRSEKKIEVDNPNAKVSLHNADLIELGKAVVLRYIEIKD